MFLNSLISLNKGDAKATYDQMRKAITMSPYVDRYHAAYAQTNIAIAQSMAQNKNITDAEKQTIATLIQQAIREGKNVVILNPTRSGGWELLARIYQAIIPFAQGSDQFALQTYSQSIALDPINPNLRIALGGVFYSLGQYDSAIDTFKLAVAAKPDYANSHYNLSAAYREKKDYVNAISEMNGVLALVPKDSNDYKTAQAELEALNKKKPATTNANQPTELTQPEKVTKANPQIELPKEATPPATTTQ
jgi:tetratricopeptide (TPR) repeat protein